LSGIEQCFESTKVLLVVRNFSKVLAQGCFPEKRGVY